jgi:homoserine dehydrogenase
VKAVRIGLLGCGTVGGGVVKLLRRNSAMLTARLGDPLFGLTADLITRDSEALVTRPDIDVVVELFGGIEPAQSLILKALAAGKDIVTANKALLSEHGDRIFKAAVKRGRFVGFEASVGGGIPIIRTLREALAGDRQRAVYGIVNGTCNYILSTMAESGAEFTDVLAQAQRSGLAEADPSLDVGGHDAAHKLALLVTLAFGAALKPRQVYTEGITRITLQDLAYAREFGFAVKLLAIAKSEDGAIEARVHPTMVPIRHLLAGVVGAYNAIYIQGEAMGSTMYFGLGAGEMPTATAVVADILEIARMRRAGATEASDHALGYPYSAIKPAKVKPMDRIACQYYLRFMAEDKPGVLGRIASVLGRHKISIASMIQQGRAPEVSVPVVMRTHESYERNLTLALAEIRRRKIVKAEPVFIRIEEQL